MSEFKGQAVSWQIVNGGSELGLHREPCNEIGSGTLEELETFAAALAELAREAHALIIHSTMKAGFSAGADLRGLYEGSQGVERREGGAGGGSCFIILLNDEGGFWGGSGPAGIV